MKDTILIIEDDPDIAECLWYNLQLAGLQSVAVHNGEQGLLVSLTAEDPPALVLLDLHLPDVDGLEVCRRLRAEPTTQSVPIVMLTAYASDADKERGFQAGANTYVSKPYSMREIISIVRLALSRSEEINERVGAD